MTWTSVWPQGDLSVKANESPGAGNTAYIESTMKLDHHWNTTPLAGRHLQVNMPKQSPTPGIATGCDGVMYLKGDGTTSDTVQGFYDNVINTYQFIPAFLSSSVVVGSSFGDLVTVPAGVYGDIFMFRTNANGSVTIQTGSFKSTLTGLAVVANRMTNPSSSQITNLIFDRSSLKILVKTGSGIAAGNTWEYRITYRAI